MKLSNHKIKFIHNTIQLELYKWRLQIAEQELNTNFSILSSMKRPQIDLQIDRISQLNNQDRKLSSKAFVKQIYYREYEIAEFKLTEDENNLILSVVNPHQFRGYTIYPDDFGDVDNPKYQPSKNIYNRKLFNRLKKKIQSHQELVTIFPENNWCEFTTNIGQGFEVVTNVSVDLRCYSYFQDIYKDGNRIRFLMNHPVLIGFPCYGWAICQDEDIEIALTIILDCCQQFISKISEIVNINVNALDLD
jgi:hypothetical protein